MKSPTITPKTIAGFITTLGVIIGGFITAMSAVISPLSERVSANEDHIMENSELIQQNFNELKISDLQFYIIWIIQYDFGDGSAEQQVLEAYSQLKELGGCPCDYVKTQVERYEESIINKEENGNISN